MLQTHCVWKPQQLGPPRFRLNTIHLRAGAVAFDCRFLWEICQEFTTLSISVSKDVFYFPVEIDLLQSPPQNNEIRRQSHTPGAPLSLLLSLSSDIKFLSLEEWGLIIAGDMSNSMFVTVLKILFMFVLVAKIVVAKSVLCLINM